MGELASVFVMFSYIVVGAIEKFNLSQKTFAFILFTCVSAFSIGCVIAGRISDTHPMESAIFGSFLLSISMILVASSRDILSLVDEMVNDFIPRRSHVLI